jgi:hypothetical protein
VGHGGLWGLDIDEATLQDNFSGRIWKAEVMDLDEIRVRKNKQKEIEEDRSYAELEKSFLRELDACNEPPSQSKLRKILGWRDSKLDRVLARLCQQGVVECFEGKVRNQSATLLRRVKG